MNTPYIVPVSLILLRPDADCGGLAQGCSLQGPPPQPRKVNTVSQENQNRALHRQEAGVTLFREGRKGWKCLPVRQASSGSETDFSIESQL